MVGSGGGGVGGSTEDDFLGRSEHIEGGGDLVLVVLQLEPADKGCEVGCGPTRGMAVGGRRHTCVGRQCATATWKRKNWVKLEVVEIGDLAEENERTGFCSLEKVDGLRLSVAYVTCMALSS